MSSSSTSRINPKFIVLCKSILDSIEDRLVCIEQGFRYPYVWAVNEDLVRIAEWTKDIPELQSRVEKLGERYAQVSFISVASFPPKYLPMPKVLPSTRPGHIKTPITDDEVMSMIAALNDDGFPTALPDDSRSNNPMLLMIDRHVFHSGRLRRALESGLVSGGPVAQLDGFLHTLLIAMSRRGIATVGVKQAARALSESFPQNAEWLEKRFGVIRRRLIKEGYLKRAGRSYWVRVDEKNSNRAKIALVLLERLEQAGADPFNGAGSSSKKQEDSQ